MSTVPEPTVVHQWHVTGEPGPINAAPDRRYPSYSFVFRSDDERWPDEKAEERARGFVSRTLGDVYGKGRWESGPFLHHRTVTYSPLEPVEVVPAKADG